MAKKGTLVNTNFREGGLWAVNWYVYRYLRPWQGILLLISILFLLIGLPGKFSQPSKILYGVGFLGLGFSMFRVLSALRSARHLIVEDNKDLAGMIESLRLNPTDQAAGFEIVPLEPLGDWVSVSRRWNAELRKARSLDYAVHQEGTERVLANVRGYRDVAEDLLRFKYRDARRRRKAFINEQKVGLHSNLPVDGPVRVYPIGYFTSLLTNDLAHETIYPAEGRKAVHDGLQAFPALQVPQSDGTHLELQSFAHSGLANHIGASALVVTADRWVVIWKQGHKNLRSPGLAAPSGSGSADWSDLDGPLVPHEEPAQGEFIRFLESAMIREFLEESHRRGESVFTNSIQRIRTIGFYRWLSRGGKPEFVGVAKSTARFDDLTPNSQEVFLDGQGTNGAFHFDDLEDLASILCNLTDHPENSIPQEMNLRAWLQWIEEDPEDVGRFLFE